MASWGPGHCDVYLRGMDSAIWHRWYLNNRWSNWESLGGTWMCEPVVITRKNHNIDVFCLGIDSALYYRNFDGKKWNNWLKLGGVCASNCAVTSRDGKDILDVVVLGTDHAMYHKYMYQGKWYPSTEGWSSWGGRFKHTLSGATWGEDHNSFFAVGFDSNCYERRWKKGEGWQEYKKMPGRWAGAPKAICLSSGNIEVIGRNEKSALNHVHVNGGHGKDWQAAVAFDGQWREDPDLVSWGKDRMDVFSIGYNSKLYHKQWSQSGGWSGWQNLGGVCTSKARAVTIEKSVNVFALGTKYHLHHKWKTATGQWGPSAQGFEDLGGVASSAPGGKA